MKVTYVGPYADGVEIAATGQVVAPGETVEVPDNLGALLVEQEYWKGTKPTDDTVDGVLKSVGDDPDLARAALEAERANKNRSTLVSALEKIINPEGE